MPLRTDRLSLPLLAVAQAQKEMTHNEALALLDAAVQPVIVAVAPAAVPASPAIGQCWIVGSAASGAWAGHDGALAAWTQGGWRFVAAFEGMAVWSIADQAIARRGATSWSIGTVTARSVSIGGLQVVGPRTGAIAAPAGGSIVDGEARAALTAVLAALRTHGLISA